MERSTLKDSIKAIGLTVSKLGIVSGEEGDYGILERAYFHSVDDRFVDYDDLLDFSGDAGPVGYIAGGMDHKLQFFLKDGTVETFIPGHYDNKDKGVGAQDRKMPKAVSELSDVLPELYPDLKEKVYYDVLEERLVFDMSLFGRGDLGTLVQSDSVMSAYYVDIEHRLKEHGFEGAYPSKENKDLVLSSLELDNQRNLFREWVESHEWDGVPRLRTWFQDTFGATAPPLQETGEEDKYLGDVAEAWFIGGIRRMYKECKHEIVPVLISPQGIGKGQAIKYTAGKDCWYKETVADLERPDKFLDTIRGGVVVELGESRAIKSSDHDTLKSFISKTNDQYRKPYARFDNKYPRHFIFIATSNSDNIFTDVTGNRRFFPMYLDTKKAKRKFSEGRSKGQYDVEQVWAEALHMYNEHHMWYVGKECKRMAKVMQLFATVENTGVDMIDAWLDENKPQIGSRTSRKEILYNVFNVTDFDLAPKDVRTAFNAWASSGTSAWKKVGSIRIKGFEEGRPQKGYERIRKVGELPEESTLLMVADDDLEEEEKNNDPYTLFRNLAVEQGIRDAGDFIDVSALSEEQMDLLINEGLIYESGIKNGVHLYRIVDLI